MMRKVMLVDDEYMLLRGLKLLVDWKSLGLELSLIHISEPTRP